MTEEQQARVDFLWNVHSYTNEYIRFADTKAALTVAWATALLGVLYAERVHAVPNPETGFWVTSLLAAAALCAGFVLSVWSILPRLLCNPIARSSPKNTKTIATKSVGLIYWGDVLSLNDAVTYQLNVSKLDDENFVGVRVTVNDIKNVECTPSCSTTTAGIISLYQSTIETTIEQRTRYPGM